MNRLALVLALGTLCAGCASVDWLRHPPDWLRTTPEPSARRQEPDGPERRLTRADELVRDGQPNAARDLYEQLVVEPSKDAVHAIALYKLARLYTDPASGLLDYRAAQVTFERLLAEYPPGAWEADARAWRATLQEVQAREAEAAQLKREATKLKADLEAQDAEAARLRSEATKLKADLQARDAETARLKDEAAKLKASLQRLKRIDMNFERKR